MLAHTSLGNITVHLSLPCMNSISIISYQIDQAFKISINISILLCSWSQASSSRNILQMIVEGAKIKLSANFIINLFNEFSFYRSIVTSQENYLIEMLHARKIGNRMKSHVCTKYQRSKSFSERFVLFGILFDRIKIFEISTDMFEHGRTWP